MLNLITANWPILLTVLGVIIEMILRLKPTERNLSIIDLMHRVINAIIPNEAKGTDETGAPKIGKIKFKIKK